MKRSNFALRLQPSLMEAARKLAESEGVALNQLVNIAVAQLVASHGAANYIAERAKRGNVERALEILRRPQAGEPPQPGDEIPESWKEIAAARSAYARFCTCRNAPEGQPIAPPSAAPAARRSQIKR